MPRFWRGLFGPRVTVSPQVISGPASPGQQVWIGRRDRSTSAPSQTISWHGALERSLGAMSKHLLQYRQLVPGIFQSARRIGLLQIGEQLADFAQRRDRVFAHRHRHAPGRAEQIAPAPEWYDPAAARTAVRGRRA